MVGKQTATSKHPCSHCMTSSLDFQKADHYTFESLCRLYNQWMAGGAYLKKVKKYTNCEYSWSTYTARCCRQNFVYNT